MGRNEALACGLFLALLGRVDRQELRERVRVFAFEVVDLCLALGADDLSRLVRPQLLRAGTGVAANYRAACRGRSMREFASRLGVAVEEADESELWLDLLQTRRHGPAERVTRLRQESRALLAIFAAARGTALDRLRSQRRTGRPSNP